MDIELNPEEKKLEELAQKAQPILLSIKTVFPFQLFPKRVVIDAKKVSIISSEFFSSEHITSILISGIEEVTVETSLFFATLKIDDGHSNTEPIVVPYLRKEEAMRARNIIQGLVIAKKEQIDITKVENTQTLEKVESLGNVPKEG